MPLLKDRVDRARTFFRAVRDYVLLISGEDLTEREVLAEVRSFIKKSKEDFLKTHFRSIEPRTLFEIAEDLEQVQNIPKEMPVVQNTPKQRGRASTK